MKNIRVNQKVDLSSEPVHQAIMNAEQELGSAGRLLVRASGTEPLIRIMAQGDDKTLLLKVIHNVAEAIRDHGCLAA